MIRRRDCAHNLDTLLVYTRKHWQMIVELQCSVPQTHGEALHEDFTWAGGCEAA